jgi:hypothetical protein
MFSRRTLLCGVTLLANQYMKIYFISIAAWTRKTMYQGLKLNDPRPMLLALNIIHHYL